jgi:hypothetical protein
LEQRKDRRFPIQQPVDIKIHGEDGWRNVDGITKNASASGVFLLADSPIPLGAKVELTIILTARVKVHSPGKVVRVTPSGDKIGIAVACDRPFTELRAS